MMQMDRRTLVSLGALAVATPAAAAPADPTEIIRLWPGRPPGAPAILPAEQITDRIVTTGWQDRFVTGIATPLMTVFRPARPTGAAALVIPGGGYIRVVIDKEGFEIARRFAAAGITAYVLRYRLPREGWTARDVALQDARRAMDLIRADGGKRVVALGCSAGGHVAASLATGPASRPDLSALLYPVIDMARPHAHAGSREALLGAGPTPELEAAYSVHRHVTADTPPTFLVHALDDASVPPENSLAYLAALRAAKVPAEAHFFEQGGHGFGIRLAEGKPAHAWAELFLSWAKKRALL